ncbi:hypothetical protein [Microbacterium sp. J1-1]|uniref:hypothetical protein n=1 Tax=Microbacterium sp. J1-1 TaxID=2992441 RepID=UPI0021149F15|nr:hypothetical protein [Microbacterium sp. J1-1]UUE19881.1 hypothetical protein LRQ07_13935 [Microbacterium sp. J1-1]
MNVSTWCILTKAITWCNEAGTDGLIKRRYLGLFHPEGLIPSAYAELVEMGIWAIVDGGYQFVDWAKPSYQGGLGQSTAEAVKTGKANAAARARNYRARKEAAPVTRDATGDITGDVGQDRTGQALYASGSQTATWETATPGQPHLKVVS